MPASGAPPAWTSTPAPKSPSATQPHCLPLEATLLQQLKYGLYGRFCQAATPLAKHGFNGFDSFSLPDLVVIGNAGSGKSALLRSLTGCSIFASRSQQGSTMAPVRVIFEAHGSRVMKAHCNGSDSCAVPKLSSRNSRSDQLTSDQVVIKAGCAAQDFVEPGSEFSSAWTWSTPLHVIDLPGLRELPSAAKRMCSSTAEDHAELPDAIVLCVIEAAAQISSHLERWLCVTALPATE